MFFSMYEGEMCKVRLYLTNQLYVFVLYVKRPYLQSDLFVVTLKTSM